ncbi:MAG: hypothetical protein WAV98_00290, partial [Minisyncoccia bacterium]
MENETEKILKEQLRKLPKEVRDFILSASWDTDADEIGSLYNLSEEEVALFKQEVTLVLAGLIHPDEFKDTLEGEGLVTNRAVLEAIVANVEEKIFAPIRPALISFFEKESSESESVYGQAFVQDVNLVIQKSADSKSKVESGTEDTKEAPHVLPVPNVPPVPT